MNERVLITFDYIHPKRRFVEVEIVDISCLPEESSIKIHLEKGFYFLARRQLTNHQFHQLILYLHAVQLLNQSSTLGYRCASDI